MASKKEYLGFILEQLSDLDDVSYRAMMGEYILYYHRKIIGGIYDDRLLVKPVPAAVRLMPDAPREQPYPGAKEMLLVENVDDRAFLCGLLESMFPELPAPKKKITPKNKKMIKLKYGNTNTFLIPGTGSRFLLVDTDYAGKLPDFFKALGANNLRLNDIAYVLATHYHPDHIGLIGELTGMGVTLLLVSSQAGAVHLADRIFAREKHLQYTPIDESKATVITPEESRNFLQNIGISGEIVRTPSHSADSISLILDNGDCFVGDLEPIEYLGAYESNPGLQGDWNCIMSRQPRRIFYSHANEKIIL